MKQAQQKEIKESLAQNHNCYVLITCDEPSEEGKMNVELSYEGDPVLAAYLLQGAQDYLDHQEDDLPDSSAEC